MVKVAVDSKSGQWWWLAALALPLPAFGAVYLSRVPNDEWDSLENALIALIFAAALATILSVVAMVRKERRRRWSLIAGVPGVIVLVAALWWLVANRAGWI